MCVLHAMTKKYTNPSCSFFIELTVCLVFSGISVFMSHSIRYLGPYISNLWGKINKELRSKTNLQAFKKAVRAINVLDMLDGACRCHACSS